MHDLKSIMIIIMKIISSDITEYFKILNKPLYMFHKLHVVADVLTANSFIKCCNYEVFIDFVWLLNFHYEKQKRGGLRGAEWANARSTSPTS